MTIPIAANGKRRELMAGKPKSQDDSCSRSNPSSAGKANEYKLQGWSYDAAMLQLRNDITFERFWELTKGCYKSFEIRCVAEKTQDLWQNIMFSCFGTRREPEIAKRQADQDYAALTELRMKEIEELGIFYEVAGPDRTPQYMEMFRAGEVLFKDVNVRLREDHTVGTLWEAHEQGLVFGDFIDYPIVQFPIGTRTGATASSHLYNDLVARGMVGGVDELGDLWLKITPITARALNGQLFFPLYLGAADMTFSDNELSMRTKAHKDIADQLSLSIALRRGTQSGRRVVAESKAFSGKDLPHQALDEDLSLYELKYKFKVVPVLEDEVLIRGASDLGVLLNESRSVRDLSRTMEFKDRFTNLLAQFIEVNKLGKIAEGKARQLLKLKTGPDVDFERVVSYVLGMVGMVNAHLGDTHVGVVRRRDGIDIGEVDIVAEDTMTQKLYVIDCTTNPPKDSKIDVAADIVLELEERGIHVEPLIFVGNYASEAKRNSRKVKVVDREDIKRVLDLVRQENIVEARRIITEPPI